MEKQPISKVREVLWAVRFGLMALLVFAFLELNKHTLLGWGLALALFAGYALLRRKKLRFLPLPARLGAGCALLCLTALVLWVSWPPVRPVPAVEGKTGGVTAVRHVAQGDLTGVKTPDGQVEVYTGVPYAAPPVGDLRWREPQPPAPWQGVRACDHFAPMSMQTTDLPAYSSLAQIIGYHDYHISLTDNYRPPVSEDSLYLNIWKPAGEQTGLPVLVYVHGGSLQTGQPWYADYSGEGLAREGVVAVNMGYRLGVFGFLAHADLAKESPNGTTGNYGLLDQIAALRWVRDNIAAFGGDPDNVTLAGESAGSACVTALCVSPLARGLFRRVVAESSTVTAPEPAHSFRSLEDALKAGETTLQGLGVSGVEALRQLPAEKLVGLLTRHHHLTVDGFALPMTPYEAYRKGIHNEEAQLHGFNRYESGPFILFGQADLKNYAAKVRAAFPPPYAERVLALYPAGSDAEARAAWADIYSAVLFTYGHFCLERQALQNGIPTWVYHFVKDNGRLGAWHSGEEVYLYGNIPADSTLYDATDRALSGIMKGYLVNYVRNGDPNGGDLPLWPASTGDGRVMEFGLQAVYTAAPYAELYTILDEINGFTPDN